MTAIPVERPQVFVDADVLFAGAVSPNEHSASLVVLRMAEITMIEAITSRQVITEAERNLTEKMPRGLALFHLLVERSLRIVDDPAPGELKMFDGAADPADLPILVAAVREKCAFLTTYNVRHYRPGVEGVVVLTPGDLVLRIRYLLSTML